MNANIAMVSAFSLHDDHEEAIRRGEDGFRFFEYAIGALVTDDVYPGRSALWEKFQARKAARERGEKTWWTRPTAAKRSIRAGAWRALPGSAPRLSSRRICRDLPTSGVDQVIFLQQGGNNQHEHICESLEMFHGEVLEAFAAGRDEREARKAEELAPYIEAALARRETRPPMSDGEIPIVPASRPKPQAAS